MVNNKDVVRQLLESMNKRDYETLDQLLDSGFQRHCQATPQVQVKSAEEFKAFIKLDHQSFPDGVMKPKMMVAEDNTVAGLYTYSGTQQGPLGELPALGKTFVLNFVMLNTVENGKVLDMHVEWDNLALLGQLGHM